MRKKRISHILKQADRTNSQRGATVVEFAFIAALVFLIIFGILEFGLIFLQEHYVANASREAARIGVRANNYNCFAPDGHGCISRTQKTRDAITEYLDIFYEPDEIGIAIQPEDDTKSLVVRVTIANNNIIKSGVIPFTHNIEFTSSMAYEDQKEYDNEHSSP